jgi:ribosomal protein S18 acetylase RimI-like enzyme
MLDIAIRSMTEDDLTTVDIIEKTCFGQASLPRRFLEELHRQPNTTILVACLRKIIVGYLILEGQSKNNTAYITRLVVHPIIRRKGIAKLLLQKVIDAVHPAYGVKVKVEVPETHLPVQLLLRSKGFKAVQILHGDDADETQYLFEYQPTAERLPAPASVAARS